VVNVTHNNDNRASFLEIVRNVFLVVNELLFNGNNDFFFDDSVVFHSSEGSGVKV